MTDHRLDLAEALLAKARSTSFEGERDSFVSGAYQQLGAFLDAGRPALHPEPEGGPRADRSQRTVPATTPPVPVGTGADDGLRSGAGAVPGDGQEPGDDDTDEVLVVDLAAAERAYRSQSAWGARAGALIDLTI